MDAYLRKAGLTRGNIYTMLVLITGGGYVEKHHGDDSSAMQAQIASLDTAVALCQQSQTFMEKRFDELDRDLKDLTRAVNRIPQRPLTVN